MSVNVTTATAPVEVAAYPTGAAWEVNEEVLYITDSSGEEVAVYARGVWAKAEVVADSTT